MAILTSSINIGVALAYKYPLSETLLDHTVRYDPETQMFILENWNLPDLVPTEQDIEQWYLEYVRQQKLKELAAARDAAIFSTFPSACTGTTYTYTADDRARVRYHYLATKAYHDSTYAGDQVYTHEAGLVHHNPAQLIQLADDCAVHEREQWEKYHQLVTQVQAAATVDEVNNIKW